MGIDLKALSAWAGETNPEGGGIRFNGGTIKDGLDAQVQAAQPRFFGNLVPLLRESEDEIFDAIDELPTSSLMNVRSPLDELDRQTLVKGVKGLDPQLQAELAIAAKGISLDDATELAEFCDAIGSTLDIPRFAAWLVQVGKI